MSDAGDASGEGARASLDYDALAAAYARSRGGPHPGVLRGLIEGAALGAGCPDPVRGVVEVGCGTGTYTLALAAATGCAVTGIDPSEGMLRAARARAGTATFRSGRAERLDLPDSSVDLVFSVDVIHHVTDRAAYFAEAVRILRPGGQVCTATDSHEMIRRRRPLASHFPETVAVELRRYPPIERLEAEMAGAGFQAIRWQQSVIAYELKDAQAYRDRAFSSLHLIEPAAFARGIAQLEADLGHGTVAALWQYVLLWGAKPAR